MGVGGGTEARRLIDRTNYKCRRQGQHHENTIVGLCPVALDAVDCVRSKT